ncbi:MAG: hypothetical protein IJV35_02345 [Neisseriaceae bacterium]|nr:hypothetical protein [Neisseriaceae bacterium]
MSKVSKFFVHPIQFWVDFFGERNKVVGNYGKTIFAFHINDWKRRFVESIFPEYDFVYIPFKATDKWLHDNCIAKIVDNVAQSRILVWGMWLPKIIQQNDFIMSNIPITWVEDGFIRSIGLGSGHVLPASLNFDSRTCYFDARKESDLEHILNTYDFDADVALMQRAVSLKQRLLSTGISKYNHSKKVDIANVYGPKRQTRILVVGQVEDDASIAYGCLSDYNNNDIVRIAAYENPDAQIIYKPHPDVLHQKREKLSDPRDVADICQVLNIDIPLSQSFETIDHVYTISSQAGFEALLRGISVTTLGCPFYSGWGCTDDRQKNDRRIRKLTVEQILAAAYILYPKYYHPLYKNETDVESVLQYFETVLNGDK